MIDEDHGETMRCRHPQSIPLVTRDGGNNAINTFADE
jgi:hypothetical protein